MATAYITVKRVEFIIGPTLTHCNVFYEGSEQGTPWGGGWKTKTFPASESAIEILRNEVSEYIVWNDGREEEER